MTCENCGRSAELFNSTRGKICMECVQKYSMEKCDICGVFTSNYTVKNNEKVICQTCNFPFNNPMMLIYAAKVNLKTAVRIMNGKEKIEEENATETTINLLKKVSENVNLLIKILTK